MLYIQTLGKFQLRKRDVVLDSEQFHSEMQIRLLIFLLLHRDKMLTTEEIASAIWQNESIRNPAGALKNLMYRLRHTLKDKFGEEEYFISGYGCYGWNTEIEIEIDIEKMELLYQEAKRKEQPEDAILYYQDAINIFQGDFMSPLFELEWVSNLNTYYHTIYVSMVCSLCRLYRENGQMECLRELCNEALRHEKTNEIIYYYLIQTQIQDNNFSGALDTYEHAKQILEREIGIKQTDILHQAYEEILEKSKADPATDIKEIYQNINEEKPEGVFMCGFPVFREICRLEERKRTRSEENIYLMLLSLYCKQKDKVEVNHFRLNRAMKQVNKILNIYLRLGDVAAEYSETQYIILLSKCQKKNEIEVANRIQKQFQKRCIQSEYVELKFEIKAFEEMTKITE